MKNLNKWWPGLNYINSQFQILISLPTTFDFQKKKKTWKKQPTFVCFPSNLRALPPQTYSHYIYTHTQTTQIHFR